MLNIVTEAEVCDARDDDSSTVACYTKSISFIRTFF
jgi:hypothetical protein